MKTQKIAEGSFLSHLDAIYYRHQEIEPNEVQSKLNSFRQLATFPLGLLPVYYIIDYSCHKYLMLTEGVKTVSGYDAQEFLEGGISRLLDIYNKDDFETYNTCVFRENQAFLKTQRDSDSHYVFSYNFRIKGAGGTTIHIFQQGTYIIDPSTRSPVYSIGAISDITCYKQDSMMVHKIERVNKNDQSKQAVITNYFFPNQEDTLLSQREKEILCCMAEGLCSKEVAAKLRISINTVDNHRRNMLKKTNSNSMIQLVAFAIRNRII